MFWGMSECCFTAVFFPPPTVATHRFRDIRKENISGQLFPPEQPLISPSHCVGGVAADESFKTKGLWWVWQKFSFFLSDLLVRLGQVLLLPGSSFFFFLLDVACAKEWMSNLENKTG